MNRRKTCYLFLILCLNVFFTTSLFGKSSYEKAWEAFFNNNRTDARKYFNQATKDKQFAAYSYWGLSLVDWSETKLESAFENIQKFHELADDPDAYLYSAYSLPFMFTSLGVLENEKLEFLERIITTPLHGTLKAMIYSTLGSHYMACRDFEKAQQLFSQTGALPDWQILGAFDNISGSGFDKDWNVVNSPASENQFKNKTEAVTRWNIPGRNRADGWIDFNYYFNLDEIICYAQTFISSPEEQEVYVRVGTSGSLKVWLNDVLITSVSEERNCDVDIYACKVRLNKGNNRLLLQLGQSEINALNFLVRLTDDAGNPVSGLNITSEYTSYQKEMMTPFPDAVPLFAEGFLLQKIQEEPENPIHSLALAEAWLRNDKAEEAIYLLRQLREKAPRSSFVHYRLAEAYARAQNPTYYTRELEAIKQYDPDGYFSLDAFVREAQNSGKIDEVKELRQKIAAIYSESDQLRVLDTWLATRQNNQQERIDLARNYYKKYPYRYDAMNMVFGIEEHTLKNSKAATEIVEEFCSKYFHESALELLSGRYIKDGETEKGLELLRFRIEKMPYAVGYINSYAYTLYQMQRYEEALEMTDRMLSLSPEFGDIYRLRGDIYKQLNENEKAIDSYRKALYYNPVSFETRTQLNQLEGKKEWFELFPSYNLDSLILSTGDEKVYPGDNSVVLLYDLQRVFYPEGANEFRILMAVKVLNQSGVESWSEYQIPYSSNQQAYLDKAELIKKSGQRVKAENSGGHIVFTNIEVEDVLYIEYRVRELGKGVFSKHFSDQHTFKFNFPSRVVRYSLMVPENRSFEYKVNNGDMDPQISVVKGNMKLYSWTLTDQASVKPEPLMSELVDIVPTLFFSSVPDWQFVSNWYKDLTSNKFLDDYLLTEVVNEILQEKEDASDLEKARLFYDYILKNIAYSDVPFMQNNFIPQRASRTLSTRLGDCKDVSTLFVAMCRKVGIKANLVLVMTKDSGQNILLLPMNYFNHCIARIDIGDEYYYLELTDSNLSFGSILFFERYSPVLVIPYGEEEPADKILSMDSPYSTPDKIIRNSELTLTGQDGIVETTTVRYGSAASYTRYAYRDIGEEERVKNMTQSIAVDYTSPVRLIELRFGDLDALTDSLVYSNKVEAKSIMHEIAGMKIFKIRWSDSVPYLEVFSLEERQTPLEFWKYMYDQIHEENCKVVLPEGTALVETPQNVHLECENAVYKLNYNVGADGVMHVQRIFEKKTEMVTVSQYIEFREFMHAVSEYDNKQYAVK